MISMETNFVVNGCGYFTHWGCWSLRFWILIFWWWISFHPNNNFLLHMDPSSSNHFLLSQTKFVYWSVTKLPPNAIKLISLQQIIFHAMNKKQSDTLAITSHVSYQVPSWPSIGVPYSKVCLHTYSNSQRLTLFISGNQTNHCTKKEEKHTKEDKCWRDKNKQF